MRGARVAFAAVLLLGAVYGAHLVADPDVFQQVAVGRATLAHPGSIGTSNFHPQFPAFPYVADKWLSSVIAALFDAAGGGAGLVVYQLLLSMLTAALWWRSFRAWGAGPAASLAATALALAAAAFRLEPRPEAWSQILLAALVALLATERPPRRTLAAIAVIFALWVNLHGYFLAGLLVLGAACAAALVAPPPALRAGARNPLARAALVLGVAVAACVVHPQGVRALWWPFEQLLALRDQAVLRAGIQELFPSTELLRGAGAAHWALLIAAALAGLAVALWPRARDARLRLAIGLALGLPWLVLPPPNLVAWPYRLTVALFAAALVEAPLAIRRGDLFRPLVFFGLTVLALPVARNLSLVPPAALLLLAPAWSEIEIAALSARRRRALAATVAASVALACGWARVSDRIAPGNHRAPGWTGLGIAADEVPVGAADFVLRHDLPGPLLDTFQDGGYLLYRMFPRRTVLIAGNTSFYPASFLATYRGEIAGGTADPDELFTRYGVRTAVLEHAAMETPQLLARLAHSRNWRPVYLDRAAVVFLRCDEATAAACGQLGIDLGRAAGPLIASASSASPVPRWLAPRPRTFPALNLGIALRAMGRPDLGLALADRLWAEAPGQEIATFAAAAAEEAGRLPDLVPRLEVAYARWPDAESVRTWLARALYVRAAAQLGKVPLATVRADAERSLALTPDAPGTLVLLARVRAESGAPDEARDLLARALPRADASLRQAILADPLLGPLAAEKR